MCPCPFDKGINEEKEDYSERNNYRTFLRTKER